MASNLKENGPGNNSNGPEGPVGYGYPSGYNTYGYGGYGDTSAEQGAAVHRTLTDYIHILRERLWYILAVFLVVFSGAMIFAQTRTKLYEASASVQVLRKDSSVLQVQGMGDNEVRSAEDLNTQVKVLESTVIVQKVISKLTSAEKSHILEPFKNTESTVPESARLEKVILDNRKVTPYRLSLLIAVSYVDSDPVFAAKVANALVDEYLSYNSNTRVDESMRSVDDLKLRADEQKLKVDALGRKVQEYREKNNRISLDQRKDITTEKLKSLSLNLTQASVRLSDAEIKRNQVKERVGNTQALLELSYISLQPNIAGPNNGNGLVQQVSSAKIVVARLSERYRAKHPSMVQAVNQLKQTEQELDRAVAAAALAIEAEYQSSLRTEREARAALSAQEAESLDLDRSAVEFNNLTRDYEINEKLLETMISRMQETSVATSIQTVSARIVDRAQPPTKPSFPKMGTFLALSFIGGIGLGIACALVIAKIDDRIKSSYDIESLVGIPLVGIIPQIKSKEITERAHISLMQLEPQVSESFLSLHAALQVKEQEKRAQTILITSTAPSEGKSMIVANLAAMCGSHGQKTVLVDCDLRKPVQHRYHGMQNKLGVADYCKAGKTLAEVTNKTEDPNVDLISVGTYTKNPTQILSSKEFRELIAELKTKYDRVFLDTPPVAVVSDSLLLMPLADAFLYTIFFNRIRVKTAKFCVKKVVETNVPCFGAILNGLDLKRANYYYSHYYNKSYQKYYNTTEKEES